MKKLFFILTLLVSLPISAERADSLSSVNDSLTIDEPKELPAKKTFFQKLITTGKTVFNYINDVDTTYVRPQEYNWAVMLQSTTTLESYDFLGPDGEFISFAPDARTKIGPYAGWRWAFFGYAFDIKKLHISERVDINLSFYSPIFNIDFVWRESGNRYKIREALVNTTLGTEEFRNISFPGIDTYMRGINFNYVLKHRKYSMPAAFSQSSCQLRSAGSPIVGISYLHQRFSFDNDEFIKTLNEELSYRYPDKECALKLDSTFNFNKIEVAALTISGGYAHNQVLAKNLLLGASLTAGLGIKKSIGDKYKRGFSYQDFKLKNVNFDGCGRFALVYNNMRWFVGTSAIVHYYSYNKGKFHTANWFATLNLYAGFNFGKRKEYRK
ncbi:MAG: DUF4421 domain-containing protein [Prevotella sp.]|nr:DUF4421 domain-containing protein [Prevotella sp.]